MKARAGFRAGRTQESGESPVSLTGNGVLCFVAAEPNPGEPGGNPQAL